MEGFKEFQGKDLDDAIGQACSYYDTLREKLEIDIIHDAKSGIFGIVGARKAKIKARRAQLRNAVDSILGRGRDEAGGDSPAPAKAPRGQQQDRQSEKQNRSVDSRGKGRGERAGSSDSTDKPDKADKPERSDRPERASKPEKTDRPERADRPEKTDRHDESPRQDRMAPAAQAESSPRVDGDDAQLESASDYNRADSRAYPRADTERTARAPRTGRAPVASHSASPRGLRATESRPQNGHGHNGAGAIPSTGEYRYDGNSILSGQVLGYVPEPEDDEAASFGPGNEMPPSYDTYDDRNAKPRRGRTPRPTRGRPEHSQGRSDHAQARPEHSAPRAAANSILAGTLDSDALNEDALSEGLPVIPFDQLDQDRLCAISLEAVGRLVAPIVGDVPLAVELADNRVNVVLDCGDDSGLLIGREGQTLASLQYLASRLVSRGMGAAVRVQLDAGEYRLRQDEKLRDLALSLAERVRTTGKSHSTRPLSSYHRRIVHMALQEAVDIQTRSSGDGTLKRVVIQKKRGS